MIILGWTSKSIGLLFLCNVVSWFGFVLFQTLFADSTNHIKWNNSWYYCILGTRERGQEHHSQRPALGHSSPPTTISVRRSSFCFHLSSPLVAQKNIYISNLFWSKSSISSMIKIMKSLITVECCMYKCLLLCKFDYWELFVTVIYSILHTWMRQMIIDCTYGTFLLFSRCVRGCGGKVGGSQVLTLQTQCKSCVTHTWSLFACDPLCTAEISLPQSPRNDSMFSFSVNGSFVSQQVVYTGRKSLINPKSRYSQYTKSSFFMLAVLFNECWGCYFVLGSAYL